MQLLKDIILIILYTCCYVLSYCDPNSKHILFSQISFDVLRLDLKDIHVPNFVTFSCRDFNLYIDGTVEFKKERYIQQKKKKAHESLLIKYNTRSRIVDKIKKTRLKVRQ